MQAAAAIAWEFRRRHRWGLVALGLYLATLATIRLVVLGPDSRITIDDSWRFALIVIVPLSATFTYFLAVFTFGLAGDVAARESMYPARMFTLPLSNAALAGWPMLFGAAAMATLWLATRALALWPSDVHIPLIWPALFAAVLLAWTQALVWMPYALPGLRVAIAVTWLALIAFVILLALELQAPEPLMLALLAPHVPLAYLVALVGISRARHGEAHDLRALLGRFSGPRELVPGRAASFRSPARAQIWFEWQRHGRSLPLLVAILLPFELGLLFVFSSAPTLVLQIVLATLVTPPVLAAFAAATTRDSGSSGNDELTTFIATRPLTGAALIAAKLRATLRSTLVTWLLVLIAIPVALRLSGTMPILTDLASQSTESIGAPRTYAIALLGLAGLMVATWKQLVQSLYIGLSGRRWLVRTSVFATLTVLTLLVPLVPWFLRNREAMAWAWNALPLLLAIAAGCKMVLAAWIATRLHDRRLITDRTLVTTALLWCVAVLALSGLLIWLAPSMLLPRHLLVLIAVLAVPLARLSAAPLALAWNRHR